MSDQAKTGAEAPRADVGRGRRRRHGHPLLRLVRFIVGTLIQVVLVALLLALLILGTQTGLRTAVAVAEDLLPGMIQVGRVEGRVLGRLSVGELELHLPGLDLALGSLDLDWTPLAAVAGTLHIRRLAASDIQVVVAPSEEEKPKEPFALPDVVVPLAVEIDEVLVERLTVAEPDAEAPLFALDRARLQAWMQGSELELKQLDVVIPTPALKAEAKGRAQLVEGYPLDVDLSWQLSLPPGAELDGSGRIGGDLAGLVIEHEISGSARLHLDAHLQNPLEHPSWDGQVELKGIDLPDFVAGVPAIELTASIQTSGDLDRAVATGTLDGKASDLPDFGHLQVKLDLVWSDQALSLRTLDLTEEVSGASLDLGGEVDLKGAGRFDVTGSWKNLRWPLTGELLAESPAGALKASGGFDAYDYQLQASARGPSFPDAELKLDGAGTLESTRIASLVLKVVDGTIDAGGDVAWSPDIHWELALHGDGLNPGGFVEGLDDSLAFSLKSNGGLDGYAFDLSASTNGPGLPPAKLALTGTGDLGSADIPTLALEGLGGRVDAKAEVGWDPIVRWEAELVAKDLSPEAIAPEWTGKIGGKLSSEGELEESGPRLSAVIDGIEGQLRGYPVAVAGRVEMAEGSVRLDGIKASSGPSEARVSGKASLEEQTLDLTFELGSPDLASLLPGGQGSFKASGAVKGKLTAPEVRAELSAKDAELSGQGIGSLQGKVDIGIMPEGPFEISLTGANLFAGGMRFETLSVTGTGNMPRHRIQAALAGRDLSVRVAAGGSLDEAFAYRGEVSTLQLDYPPFGAWRLERAAPVELAMPKISAGPLCIRNSEGSGGCLSFTQPESGKWAASIDLDRLGTDLVAGFLPPNLVADGGARVNGRFEASGPVLDGNLTAEIPTGILRVALGAERAEALDLSGTKLTLDSGAKGIVARLDLPLKDLGDVNARAELPGWRLDAPARSDQPLRGRLQANVHGLARISGMFPDLSGVQGTLDADVRLGGAMLNPDLQGKVRAVGLGAEVPLIGLKVSGLDATLAATRDRLKLTGQGDVGGGRLTLDGGLRVGPGGVVGRVTAAGERLKVADTKEYFAIVTPRFELALDPKVVRVSGEVSVPEARIRTRTIPSGTVSPSSDVVLEEPSGEDKPALPVDINIDLKLGEEVTIDSFGVRGRLTGELRVFNSTGQDILGDGQLSIVDGLYRISGFGIAAELGKPLTIEQGRLIWAKSPIANPGLLLRAKREGSDSSASVQVQGTLRKQEMSFFSEADPGLSQAEIAKYILTGVPPKRDDQPNDSGLAVGTYVAPKLFMEYEPGLGDQKDTLRLRYEINRRLEIQTETGENQGGDIFYKFEN